MNKAFLHDPMIIREQGNQPKWLREEKQRERRKEKHTLPLGVEATTWWGSAHATVAAASPG
jgi:hypothetical protein